MRTHAKIDFLTTGRIEAAIKPTRSRSHFKVGGRHSQYCAEALLRSELPKTLVATEHTNYNPASLPARVPLVSTSVPGQLTDGEAAYEPN